MTWLKLQEETEKKLSEVSPTFCLAKWLQVTLHLQTGFTHSCHHPVPHKISPNGVKKNCHLLHNTPHKLELRKQMLAGLPPSECNYCWDIERSNPNAFSDRIIKSSDDWARPYFDEVIKSGIGKKISPRYLEVSFSHTCNLACLYCSPDISSKIWNDFKKHGALPAVFPENCLDDLRAIGKVPYGPQEQNPYVTAFWRWFPQIKKDLRVFRITGGEPLLSPEVFKLFSHIEKSPMPNLHLSINSNLMVPDAVFNAFIRSVRNFTSQNKVKSFSIYTSVDNSDGAAEFIRDGFDYPLFIKRLYYLSKSLTEPITIMVTYTLLSATESFLKFLRDYLEFKKFALAHQCSVNLDISYLHQPEYLSIRNSNHYICSQIQRHLSFMEQNQVSELLAHGFTHYEINKLKRILSIAKSNKYSKRKIFLNRISFKNVINEYQKRRKKNFHQHFPDLLDYYNFNYFKISLPLGTITNDKRINDYHLESLTSENSQCVPINNFTWLQECQPAPLILSIDLNQANSTFYRPSSKALDDSIYQSFWAHLPTFYSRIEELTLIDDAPLNSQHSSTLLAQLDKYPLADLCLNLESRLNFPPESAAKLFKNIKTLLIQKKLKDFSLITKVESGGTQEEYIRQGGSYSLWLDNLIFYLNTFDTPLQIKINYSLFSCGNDFSLLLQDIINLKIKYGKNRIECLFRYRTNPDYLSTCFGNHEILNYAQSHYSYILKHHNEFSQLERDDFKRIIRFTEKHQTLSIPHSLESAKRQRLIKNLIDATRKYSSETGMTFEEYFPEIAWILNPYDNHFHKIINIQSGLTFHGYERKDKIIPLTTKSMDKTKTMAISFDNQCDHLCLYCLRENCMNKIKAQHERELAEQIYQYPTENFPLVSTKKRKKIVADFWKTLPSFYNELHETTITGGEPLINKNAFKLLHYIRKHPLNDLDLHYETSFAGPSKNISKLINYAIHLSSRKKIRRFSLITRMDSANAQAEYIRKGIKYNSWKKNIEQFLNKTKCNLVIKINYSLLSCGDQFDVFLDYLLSLRSHYSPKRIFYIFQYCADKTTLSLSIADDCLFEKSQKHFNFIKEHRQCSAMPNGFTQNEINDFQAILELAKEEQKQTEASRASKRFHFFQFITYKDRALNSSFCSVFPELSYFLKDHYQWEYILKKHRLLEDIEKFYHIDFWKHQLIRSQINYIHQTDHPELFRFKLNWDLRTNPATLIEHKNNNPIDLITAVEPQSSPLSFDISLCNTCSNYCLYCSHDESSRIETDHEKGGRYKLLDWQDEHGVLRRNKATLQAPVASRQFINKLDLSSAKEIHITGGEPFSSPNFNFLIKKINRESRILDKLTIASSLSGSENEILGKIDSCKKIARSIEIVTTMDAFGKRGEYIRGGISFKQWQQNAQILLQDEQISVTFKFTYSLLSASSGFTPLIDFIADLRKKTNSPRRAKIEFFRCYKPKYLCITNATDALIDVMKAQYDYLKSHAGIFGHEVLSFQALLQAAVDGFYTSEEISINRAMFAQFLLQYDQRYQKNFIQTFPELKDYFLSALNDLNRITGRNNK